MTGVDETKIAPTDDAGDEGHLELGFPFAEGADDDAYAGESMQYEHDDGMHGISQQSQVGLAAYHDRDDQPHLDDCYGERQYKCSVRLAYPERHYFGVVHGSFTLPSRTAASISARNPGPALSLRRDDF